MLSWPTRRWHSPGGFFIASQETPPRPGGARCWGIRARCARSGCVVRSVGCTRATPPEDSRRTRSPGSERLVGFLGDGAHLAVVESPCISRAAHAAGSCSPPRCRPGRRSLRPAGPPQSRRCRRRWCRPSRMPPMAPPARRTPAPVSPRPGSSTSRYALHHAVAHGLLTLGLARGVDAVGVRPAGGQPEIRLAATRTATPLACGRCSARGCFIAIDFLPVEDPQLREYRRMPGRAPPPCGHGAGQRPAYA